MSCINFEDMNTCGSAPQFNKNDSPFRKVVIPANMGTDAEGQPHAPENGQYQNALVEYAANGALYIYSSDGIFTKLSLTAGDDIRLYNTVGSNTDGAMTQLATTNMVYSNHASNGDAIYIGTRTEAGVVPESSTQTGSNYVNIMPSETKSVGAGTINILGTTENDGSADAIVLGREATAADRSIAIGMKAEADSNDSVVIGESATGHLAAVIIGNEAYGDVYSVAVGDKANADNNSSVALGAYATTTRDGEVNIGTGTESAGYATSNTRIIGGVHEGILDTDAVNVKQLNDAISGGSESSRIDDLENRLTQDEEEYDTRINAKQDYLTAGEGISINNNVISATTATLYDSEGVNTDGAMTQAATSTSLSEIRSRLDAIEGGSAYIEMTSTDPGEGVELEANHFIGVYNG